MAHILCPHCGTANREGSHFCNRCGTELRPEDIAPIEPGGEQPEPAPRETPPAEQPQVTAEANKDALTTDQPWLRADFVGEDDVPLPELEEEPPLAAEGAGIPAAPGGWLPACKDNCRPSAMQSPPRIPKPCHRPRHRQPRCRRPGTVTARADADGRGADPRLVHTGASQRDPRSGCPGSFWSSVWRWRCRCCWG